MAQAAASSEVSPVVLAGRCGAAAAVRAVAFVCLVMPIGIASAGAQPPVPAAGTGSGSNPPATLGGPAAPLPPEVFARDAAGRTTIRAVMLTRPLVLDGSLDEDVYRTTPPITAFLQMLPRAGEPASEKTEAWIFYDRTNIYVAARCWDEPGGFDLANELRRDANQIRENDHFAVSFDTFFDKRNAFAFSVNPVGGRGDFTTTDEGSPNTDWNPVWNSRTARFEGGWTLEMAIPFKSLRYQSGSSQVWGVQFRRLIRHKNEWIYLTQMPASGVGAFAGAALNRVSRAATLVGLDLPSASRNLEIKPYAISRATTVRQASGRRANDIDPDVGVDAKYGITANLTADVSYNTDFAQVEVDEQQVNLTRFSLFFPEKREFFLEGRGFFEFGRPAGLGPQLGTTPAPSLFYSRRIGLNGSRVVPIDVGGRLTGKVGRVGLGVVNIQTAADEVSPATNFTVIRVKRDILRRSGIGAMFTNRSASVLSPGGSNQAFGVDGAFSFFQDVFVSGFAARTETPGKTGDDASYQARFEYGGDRYGLQVDHLLVGANFNPEVGFLRRSDFRRTFGLARFSPRLKAGRVVRRFTWEGSLDYIQRGDGALETREQKGRFNTEFQRGDQFNIEAAGHYELLKAPFAIAPGVTIARAGYQFADMTTSYTFGPQRRASGVVTGQIGHFYDGSIRSLGFTGSRISLTPHLLTEPSVTVNRVELIAGRFTTTLLRARTDYAFTPRMFLSTLAQYSSTDRAINSNIRFRWEYQPGSELFVVYTDEYDTRPATGLQALKNRAFVVKVNRLFRL